MSRLFSIKYLPISFQSFYHKRQISKIRDILSMLLIFYQLFFTALAQVKNKIIPNKLQCLNVIMQLSWFRFQQIKLIMGCGESSLSNEAIYTPRQPNQKTEPSAATEIYRTQSVLENKTRPPLNNNNKGGRITIEQIELAYDKVDGDLEKLFDELSERISEYYMKLSAEGIEEMTQHRLTQVETKVYLSEQVLLLSLDIMKVIGIKTNYHYSIDVFKFFNRSQSVMINYIKQKYPRAGNIFVPGDLMQMFKEFDMVESPENDLLRNAGICFTDSSEDEIIKKLKQFFNIVIDELDAKYSLFQALLQEKIFTYMVDGKKKSFNYKIGRKLPENMAKFQQSDTDELAITSPELFRMIIKWVTDMQEFLDSPDDEVNEKQTFKVYNVSKDQMFLDQITPDEFEGLNQALKTKLKEVNQPFRKSIHSLLREMDMFNINLLKILYTAQRKQKYVPKDEAHVIKYAMYNTKVVSWLMAQKLIMVLKNLISVGISMEETSVSRKMDLVKFNVKDLFRAMVIGTKKQVLMVYENMKKLEQEGRIKIIQIRNRLGTPLNDAMIIFTFKESFIICQLQLVLSQGQGISEKVKNIEVLNHFLYELERSPYGVLSEVAVLLGYKDNKINYEDKISFINKSFNDFKYCEQKHPDALTCEKIQRKPFICTNCTQFYHPFENIFGLKRCEACFIFQCCHCMFKNSQQVEENQINQRFSDQLTLQISDERARKSYLVPISKDVTIDDVMKCFFKKKFFFKNIFKKHYQKLQPKDLHSFIKQKTYATEQLVDLEYVDQTFFLLVQFKGENTTIKSYFWNHSLEQIQSCFDLNQNFYDLEKISTSSYDFIIFLNTSGWNEYKLTQVEKFTKLCIQPDFPYQNVKKLRAIKINAKNKEVAPYLITKVQLSYLTKLQGADQEEEEMAAKKEFLFKSIAEARKSLPSVGLVLENFQMKNYGITTPLMNDYFPKCKQKLKIRSLNLSNNKITDIQVILNECLNLDALMVSKNFIKTVQFTKPLNSLTKFIIFSNKLTDITGFANTQALRKINLQSNMLKKVQVLTLKSLQELVLSYNQFQTLQWLGKSSLPGLSNLFLQSAGWEEQNDENKSYKLNFPKLKKLVYSYNPTNILTLDCPELSVLECLNCSLKELKLSSKKIEYLAISTNKLVNLGEILVEKAQSLKKIDATNAGILEKFPKISSEVLEFLTIGSCEISDISDLQISILPRMKHLSLEYNTYKSFPKLNFPNLKVINVLGVQFQIISGVEKCNFPLIEEFSLSGNSGFQIEECPLFSFPNLKTLKIDSFLFKKMSNFTHSLLPNLEYLEINQVIVPQLPKIEFPKLTTIALYNCQVESFVSFNESLFPSLENFTISSMTVNYSMEEFPEKRIKAFNCPKLIQISVTYSYQMNIHNLLQSTMPELTRFESYSTKCKSLPIMNFPKLEILTLNSCSLEDIMNLGLSGLNKIKQIDFSTNQIKQVPKLELPSLRKINLPTNKITHLTEFSRSTLTNLEDLSLERNLLEQFPVLIIPSLKQVSLADNPMKILKGLEKIKLNNLEYLSISNCLELKDTDFPVLDLPKVTNIRIVNCNISSLKNLQKSKLPRLQQLTFEALACKQLPILKMPKLQNFTFTGVPYYESKENKVQLTDVSKLEKWDCPELRSLIIRSSDITSIPIMKFPKLQKLFFDSNLLTSAQNIKYSQLPELCEVDLNHNLELTQISIIPVGCGIDSLNMNECNLGTIPDQEDWKSTNLYFTNSKITSIGKLNLSITEYLSLQSNQIEDITLCIRQAPKLQYLYLNSNKIKSFPDIPFPVLSHLSASNNQITELSLKQKDFPILSFAAFDNNLITTLKQVSAPFLNSLILSNNKLTVIDCFKKDSPIKLSELKLDSNQINKIVVLPSTCYLYLSNNKLKNLNWVPLSHPQDWSLAEITDNEIEDVSGFFHKDNVFTGLYGVNFNNNWIKNINFNGSFPNTSYVYLSNNKIEVLDNITNQIFPYVSTIYVTDNKIKKVGPNITLKNLSSIDLTKNQLEEIQGLNCPLLNELNLTQCKLKNLDWMNKIKWPELTNLKVVSNSIKKLPKLTTVPKLTYIQADQNPLEDLDGFVSGYSEEKKFEYLSFTLKEELSLEIKEKIKQKVTKICQTCNCTNLELVPQQNEADLMQQEQQQQIQQQIQQQQIQHQLIQPPPIEHENFKK